MAFLSLRDVAKNQLSLLQFSDVAFVWTVVDLVRINDAICIE